MAVNEFRYACRYNENIRCLERNCGGCGWNPAISESRLEAYQKKNGIEKRDPNVRLINAMDATLRITTTVAPLVEKGYSPWRIMVEAIRCINAAATADGISVRCKECNHSRQPSANSKLEGLICGNKNSPCNNRKVEETDYCPYGERKHGNENL